MKFKVGDKVRVVKYGHLAYAENNEETEQGLKDLGFPVMYKNGRDLCYDDAPRIVGKSGIIVKAQDCDITAENRRYEYSLKGIPEKSAWYNEEQLVEDRI